MNTSGSEPEPIIVDLSFGPGALHVVFEDGRELSVPVLWYPRLAAATAQQRSNWRLIGRGEGVHWPDIDEDISAAGLLRGRIGRRPTKAA